MRMNSITLANDEAAPTDEAATRIAAPKEGAEWATVS
jgi:hypothetical protein